jgi:hypothetical protein
VGLPKGSPISNFDFMESIGYEVVGHTKNGKKNEASKLEYHEIHH